MFQSKNYLRVCRRRSWLEVFEGREQLSDPPPILRQKPWKCKQTLPITKNHGYRSSGTGKAYIWLTFCHAERSFMQTGPKSIQDCWQGLPINGVCFMIWHERALQQNRQSNWINFIVETLNIPLTLLFWRFPTFILSQKWKLWSGKRMTTEEELKETVTNWLNGLAAEL